MHQVEGLCAGVAGWSDTWLPMGEPRLSKEKQQQKAQQLHYIVPLLFSCDTHLLQEPLQGCCVNYLRQPSWLGSLDATALDVCLHMCSNLRDLLAICSVFSRPMASGLRE